LAESFGRGVMTNHWNDIANSDCILAIGSNPAENHPAAFGHITIAKEKGAKLISVDPRFTRTSAKADIYSPLRSGTDIAFIDGMIKYVLDDIDHNPGNYNMTYITEYTNAPYLINPDYKGTGYSRAMPAARMKLMVVRENTISPAGSSSLMTRASPREI
jgi:formate dehydrogenase major subunit